MPFANPCAHLSAHHPEAEVRRIARRHLPESQFEIRPAAPGEPAALIVRADLMRPQVLAAFAFAAICDELAALPVPEDAPAWRVGF